ncbi:MAG: hypothetical protein ACXQT4_01735 [Methanotrichaceae archaeon]
MDQSKLEEELNRILLKIADLQEKIQNNLENLQKEEDISSQLQEFVQEVITDVDYWTDQCTKTTESPPVLLRRMQTHLKRLQRIQNLIEDVKGKGSTSPP